MNILAFSWRGPGHPNAGGAEISTHEHLKGWIKAGHKVTLFTSYFPGAKRNEWVDGVEIVRAGRQVFGVQLEAFKWYLFGSKKKFDLIVDQFHGLPFFTPLYVRQRKLGFIHEVTKEIWKYNTLAWPLSLIPSLLGPLIEPLIFKLLYRSIPFMTVSPSTKKDLVEMGIPESAVSVVRNGYSHPKMKVLPSKEKTNTAIYLGAIAKDKGIEDALRIFFEINKKDPNWQFWVVGKADSKYLEFLKGLTKELGISKKVSFKGYVSEKEKFDLLARSHVLINPSIREGWGLVVIEAASVGTPTVGYNVAGLRDSIKNSQTGLLCSPNVLSACAKVISIMSDQNKYIKIQQNAIIWSKEFDWKKSSGKSLDLIMKIVNNK